MKRTTSKLVAIRPATEADFKELRVLMRSAVDHELSSGFSDSIPEDVFRILDPNRWTTGEAAAELRKMISSDDSLLVVAEANGDLIAYLAGYIDRPKQGHAVARLRGVFVRQDSRREGVGRALCDEFISWCRARRCVKATIAAAAGNVAALGLYRQLGFTGRTVILEWNDTEAY